VAEADRFQDESGLILQIPEAEDLVASYRMEYDPSAPAGVPAHITLLYPFIPPALITIGDHDRLAELFSNYSCFEISLTEFRRFPDVLYLAPEPRDSIVKLVQLIAARFPDYPPYGGQFAEINPHLTIAQNEDTQLLERIENEMAPAAKRILPISKKVTEVSLFEQSNGLWKRTKTFPLRSN
jgi:2'-5' RNA ligase